VIILPEMARLMEDSEDEFPVLADIIDKHEKGAASIPGRLGSTKARRNRETAKIAQSAVSTLALSKVISSNLQEKSDKVSKVQKPRKRLLNKQCDNPLLLPLDVGRKKTSFASFSNDASKNSIMTSKQLSVEKKRAALDNSDGLPVSEDEHEAYWSDSTDLSDFIVRDSSFLDDMGSEDILPSVVRPPMSTRRLVKGRRPSRERSPISKHIVPFQNTLEKANKTITAPSNTEIDSEGSDCWEGGNDNERQVIKVNKGALKSVKVNAETSSSGLDEPLPILSL
jgi:hypothetical protein